MITNMVEFEAQLSSAQTELQIVDKKLTYLKGELIKIDEALGEEMTAISSPVSEQLRQKLIESESQLAIFLTKKDIRKIILSSFLFGTKSTISSAR